MRLFVAVDPPPPVRERLAGLVERLRSRSPNARWIHADGAHITLVFLGWTDDAKVDDVSAAVGEVAARHRRLALHAHHGGHFGSGKKPRVLWVGLSGDVAPLGAIKDDLERALAPFGYGPERRDFSPHLTLARAKDPHGDPKLAGCLDELSRVDLGEFPVERLVLYRSDLSPKGARYTALASPPLALAG
jgi:2'-5' RNA ligase